MSDPHCSGHNLQKSRNTVPACTWIYIRDHKIDISDQIAEKGYAQVKVKDGVLADYITVVPDGNGGVGLSCGHFGYPSVESVRRSTGTF